MKTRTPRSAKPPREELRQKILEDFQVLGIPLKAEPFDAVILDVTVPGGSGAQETLPRLQVLDPNVRAIISSGYATHPMVVSFAARGFVAALVKPYGFKELEESLARAFLS